MQVLRSYGSPMLRTDRLLLRRFATADAAAFAAVLADPETMAPWGGPYDVDQARRELAHYLDHRRRHGFAPFAVVRHGRLIGDMGCQYLEDGTDVELLYRLLPDTWGIGLATEAGDAALAHAFSTLGRDEVVAVIAEDNQPSRRLAQRLGFTPGNVGTYYGQRLRRHIVTLEQHAHAVAQRLIEARTAGPELA